MRSFSLLALLLPEAVPVMAGLSPVRRADGSARMWAPARQTNVVVPPTAAYGEDGLSPAPTNGPELGEMELFKRYQMGSDTCGFASGYKCAFSPPPNNC